MTYLSDLGAYLNEINVPVVKCLFMKEQENLDLNYQLNCFIYNKTPFPSVTYMAQWLHGDWTVSDGVVTVDICQQHGDYTVV